MSTAPAITTEPVTPLPEAAPAAPPVPIEPVIERPNLQKQSLLMETTKNAAGGVIVGAIFTLGAATLGFLSKGRWGRGPAFKEAVSEYALGDALTMGTLSGLLGFCTSSARNEERASAKPYVEKIEKERESLVKDIIKNNTASR